MIETKFRDHEYNKYYPPRLKTVLIGTRLYVYHTHHRTHLIEWLDIEPECDENYLPRGDFTFLLDLPGILHRWGILSFRPIYFKDRISKIKTFISSSLHPDEIYSNPFELVANNAL